jgi:hypothetical protein
MDSWLVPEPTMTRLPATSAADSTLVSVAAALGVEAELVVPVAGEVELELAFLRHGDVGEDGLVLAGFDAEGPVRPGSGYDLGFQSQRLGQCDGDVHFVAHRRLVVRGINRQRRCERADRHRQLSVLLDGFGNQCCSRLVHGDGKAVLLRRQVEGLG